MRVTGVVQGVGFRPFVHVLATSLGLAGHVGNDDAGVFVEVEGPPAAVAAMAQRIRTDAPPLARVDSLTVTPLNPLGDRGFTIVESRRSEGAVTLVPPDTAVCQACLDDVADPGNRRYRYPFTTCTYCGPRYTIVTGLPYDRPNTTMASFPLCDACRQEYEDPTDRRFHAQPVACPECGPALRWHAVGAADDGATADAALAAAQAFLAAGGVVAIKGVGGYHLACDARDADAVARLRSRKNRGDKPFAAMARDLATALSLVHADDHAVTLLTSPQAPIVLAPARLEDDAVRVLHDAVAPRNGQLGVMLPYAPLQHLLLSPHPRRPDGRVPDVLVMTSGNLSDEPLAIDVEEAEHRLSGIADAFLHHDRGIHVGCDDSVVRAVGGHLLPVRRSRGYAPLPIALPMDAPDVLAVGGELKTTLCVASGRRAWMSQHVGDTANLETLALLERTAETLAEIARVAPDLVVADLHPGYLSHRWARERAAGTGATLALVQHHHAHLASLLAEHGVEPGRPVLGVTFDGTGYGLDGTIWGGELLLGSYDAVRRVGHLTPVRLPGGDAAIRRPARTALAHLAAAGIAWRPGIASVDAADDVERRVVGRMVSTGTGCTPTTSMGRLFDAVASLLGVRHDADYEGQPAIELEALAAAAAQRSGAGPGGTVGGDWRIDVRRGDDGTLLLDAAGAVRAGVTAAAGGDTAAAALAFHLALADAVVEAAVEVRADTGVDTVGLTGGVFQNALLTEACGGRLAAHGFSVLVHREVPPNDGGLALGQVAVAASGGAHTPGNAGTADAGGA